VLGAVTFAQLCYAFVFLFVTIGAIAYPDNYDGSTTAAFVFGSLLAVWSIILSVLMWKTVLVPAWSQYRAHGIVKRV
jgi:uncharacterized membrane protein YcaP (DUF421 family)